MPSVELLTVRDELSSYWHGQTNVWTKQAHCGFPTGDRYAAFSVAKDWLQDTGEVLLVHRQHGFSPDPYLGYVEFWGILQATFIQQDALAEMHYSVTGKKKNPDTFGGTAWQDLRNLRNRAVGHPTRKDRGTKGQIHRCVVGRQKMSYESISVMLASDETRSYETICLRTMLDSFDVDAAFQLRQDFQQLRTMISGE